MKKVFNKTVGLLIVLLLVSLATLTTLWPSFAIYYHLHELNRLQNASDSVTPEGFGIDYTLNEQAKHRDWLTTMGVFFTKKYKLERRSTRRESRANLVDAIIRTFPENHFWMLSDDNTLEVWDFACRQSEWDALVEDCDVASCDE